MTDTNILLCSWLGRGDSLMFVFLFVGILCRKYKEKSEETSYDNHNLNLKNSFHKMHFV